MLSISKEKQKEKKKEKQNNFTDFDFRICEGFLPIGPRLDPKP